MLTSSEELFLSLPVAESTPNRHKCSQLESKQTLYHSVTSVRYFVALDDQVMWTAASPVCCSLDLWGSCYRLSAVCSYYHRRLEVEAWNGSKLTACTFFKVMKYADSICWCCLETDQFANFSGAVPVATAAQHLTNCKLTINFFPPDFWHEIPTFCSSVPSTLPGVRL